MSMSYTRRKINVTPHSWLKVRRPIRGSRIVGVTLHSTRSGVRDGDDGPRTERWATNADNRVIDRGGSVSGSFQDIIIFEDGTQVECCDWETEMPTWTAGYGIDPNTWAMSDNYIQIELSQGTVDEPFDKRCIDSAAQLVAELAHRYGFPIRRIPYIDQLGTPPAGITSHEDCANGRYYKKSDPGPIFPWDAFLTGAQKYYDVGGGERMTENEKREADRRYEEFCWQRDSAYVFALLQEFKPTEAIGKIREMRVPGQLAR
jgi:hypothetical protein